MANLSPTPWLTLEGNTSAEQYMYNQVQECKSIVQSVEHRFDGWQIKFWDMEWNAEKKCWIYEIYPDETRDIIDYYNRPRCPGCNGEPGPDYHGYICSHKCWKTVNNLTH